MRRCVVHYTDAVTYGGAERMLLTVLEGLDRCRWKPVLYYHDAPALSPLVEGARRAGIAVKAMPLMDGVRGLARMPGFVRDLRTDDPSVFHAHLAWPFRCSRGLLAARIAGVPAVVATQQLFAPLSSRRAVLRHRLLSIAVDRYIAVSNDMGRALRPLCMRGDRRVIVVHNAVPRSAFEGDHLDSSPRADDRRVVLTLARLDRQKGLEHLIAAARLVPDALFLIAGDGPDRHRLEELARDNVRVQFLGHRQDTHDLLVACDLLVLPSLFEGLPVSVLEAMAAGKPVVATRIPGTEEAVVDGDTGLLVPPADPPTLAQAITAVLFDPTLARRLGAEGRSRARQLFSAERMVERLMQVYEDILEAASTSTRG
jgi:glycosyltransferase involved in cell wall biosynthesis